MSDLWRGRSVLGRWGLLAVFVLNLVLGGFGSLIAIPAAKAATPAPLLISEFLVNPNGADSPFEWVELLATQDINFVATPYSVIVANNGTATANGWVAGGGVTYGFTITTGTLTAGSVGYIGGSSMAPTGTKLRTINTGTTTGDGFGSANSGGVFGNGGSNADGIAVFAGAIGTVTSSTVPIDAIIFGSGAGTAVVNGGADGYQLPSNDHYSGGKLQSASFLAPDPGSGDYITATGTYNTVSGSFTTARIWSVGTTYTDGTSAITLSTDPAPPPPTAGGTLTATYTLPDQRLGAFQNAVLPGSITNDRNFNLGGIGSDLWHRPGDPVDEFWMITDRGPNGQIKVDGVNRRTFPVPDFDPVILHARVSGTTITILQAVPILTPDGQPVTGLSNLASHDETPYDYTAQMQLNFNPNGIDSEGLVRAADGTFWVAEEYSPSILKIGADGRVIKRFVPEGLDTTGTAYPTSATLPAILAKRKINRGFEGLGMTPDGRTLYVIVQSPLSNPDKNTGEASRQTRILALDTTTEQVVGEYVYRFDPVNTLDPQTTTQDDMKSSALVVVDPHTLLVEERTDRVARLFLVDLTDATSILGGQYDDPATTPSLEALTDTSNIPVLPKTLRVDLAALSGVPGKIEGVALVNCTTLAIANDNDFNIGTFDSNGNNVNNNPVNSVIQLITLDAPITANCVDTSAFIRTIQGVGHSSPLNGQAVTGVPGIVTALTSTGFYFQDANPDADPRTSEGIFVYTRTAPTVAVGDALLVNGTVSDFRPGGATTTNLTITELTSPTFVTQSRNNPLPGAAPIGAGGRVPPTTTIKAGNPGDVESCASPCATFDPTINGLDFWESLEGMRVQVNGAVAVGPQSDYGSNREIPVVGDGFGAGLRTSRGGIVIADDGSDFNPERIILNDLITGTSPLPAVNVGASLGDITGVIDYSFGNFKLQVTTPTTLTADGGVSPETTTVTRAPNGLTIATFNVENLSPVGTGSPSTAQSKFDRLAGIIVANLNSPDIIAVEEVQDNGGGCASDTSRTPSGCDDATVASDMTIAQLIGAIQTQGGPTYSYRTIAPVNNQDGGQPYGNIRVVFLFRTDTGVSFVDRAPTATSCPSGSLSTCAAGVTGSGSATQLTLSPGRIDPTNAAFSTSRKPLVGEFSFNGHSLFVIGNHFNSKGGDDPLFGKNQPPVFSSEIQRTLQATIVHNFVGELLAADANANVVVLGDLNDFQFSDPIKTLTGTGDAQTLYDLIETLPANERYTYVYQGNSEVLDHILVSGNIFSQFGGGTGVYDVVHANAEFADQASDHDPQVASFALVTPPAPIPGASDASVTTRANVGLTLILGASGGDGSALTYSIITPPVHGTLGAVSGNQVTYTPARDYSGPDAFTFRASDGTSNSNVATVSITVTPAPAVTYTLTTSAAGSGTVTPATGAINAGTAVALTATPSAGSTFIGWTVDGAPAGLANPLTITMNGDHTAVAAFAPQQSFPDVPTGTPYRDAILQLAARGVIKGFQDGSFGPTLTIKRAESAALIARAMGWDAEDHGNSFTDRCDPANPANCIDADLWRNVGTLAFYDVARGFSGREYRPRDEVIHVQVVSFITRAMVAKGYWTQARADDPSVYPNVPADSGHRLDLVTFVRNAGAIPDRPANQNWTDWTGNASRGWVAAVLDQALRSHFATTP